jgi:hypothetical protein
VDDHDLAMDLPFYIIPEEEKEKKKKKKSFDIYISRSPKE